MDPWEQNIAIDVPYRGTSIFTGLSVRGPQLALVNIRAMRRFSRGIGGWLWLALPAIEPLGRRAVASVDGVYSSRFCCDGVDSSHIRALTCGISLALLLQSGEAGAIMKGLRDSHAHFFPISEGLHP